jgi:glycosyltransferase involved in cell wall biosynthesis
VADLAASDPAAVSVVVCTRDRPHLLEGCLAAIAELRGARPEVIVVDNGSGGATAELVARTRFRCVREPRPGLDHARNRGIREARGGVVAFVDDDARPEPVWLEALREAFRDPRVAAVTGLVLPVEIETRAQRLFETYGGGMSRGTRARDLRRDSLRPRDLIAVQGVGVGTNMAFRREVFTAVGEFDPALDAGTPARGAGDLDMFNRVLEAGLTLRYEPRMVVRHLHRRDMAALRAQMYDNGRSFGVYLIKLWRRGRVPRRHLAAYLAFRAAWLLGRLLKRAAGRHPLPFGLLWAELRGTLDAPRAYRDAYRAAQPAGAAGHPTRTESAAS